MTDLGLFMGLSALIFQNSFALSALFCNFVVDYISFHEMEGITLSHQANSQINGKDVPKYSQTVINTV